MRRIALISVCMLLVTGLAFAEEDKLEWYIQPPSADVLSVPWGSKLGMFYRNVPVKVIEEKEVEGEKWVNITVEGWMRAESLTGSKKQVKKKLIPKQALELVSYTMKHIDRKNAVDGIYLTLRVKNNTNFKIGRWKAILIAEDKLRNVLFNTPISHKKAKIKPGEEGEVKYHWKDGEKEYDVLKNTPKETYKLLLFRTELFQ